MNSFEGKLQFSRGANEKQDLTILKNAINGCVDVVKTDTATDKRGIDYIATLEGGAKINIDAKRRQAGVSRYWKNDVELPLEQWSVYPNKVGWTRNQKTDVDMILFAFDPSDTDQLYLVPFQTLRMTYERYRPEWLQRYFLSWTYSYGDNNSCWASRCLFVPANVVLDAMGRVIADPLGTNHTPIK